MCKHHTHSHEEDEATGVGRRNLLKASIAGGVALAAAGVAAGTAQADASPYADPAEPALHRPTSMPAAAPPRAHPRVKVFSRPRPLAGGAVTSDWPTFLGPTHDAVSPETKLLKDFVTETDGVLRGFLTRWLPQEGTVGSKTGPLHTIGRFRQTRDRRDQAFEPKFRQLAGLLGGLD